jgi:aminoglycoside phosphotransferase (APT) family kinase protein
MDDPVHFATSMADVVRALRTIPVDGAPEARHRARPLEQYTDSALGAIAYASDLIDAERARAVWEEALAAAAHTGDPVWVHGDIEGNCLLREGQLSGIVDWGSACAGDPAVDIQVVWSSLFTEESRRVFLDALDVDDATLARSRGAAIQQACGALPYYLNTYPQIVERSWHKLAVLGVERRPTCQDDVRRPPPRIFPRRARSEYLIDVPSYCSAGRSRPKWGRARNRSVRPPPAPEVYG